jgi:hypothetical protein
MTTTTTLTTVIPDGDYSIDALDQIGQDGEATGVEITGGKITALLTE